MSKVKIIGETSIDKTIIEEYIEKLIRNRLIAIKKELDEINSDLKLFSKKYLINTEEFVKKFNDGKLGDQEDFFIWEGSIKVKNTLI